LVQLDAGRKGALVLGPQASPPARAEKNQLVYRGCNIVLGSAGRGQAGTPAVPGLRGPRKVAKTFMLCG